MQHYFNQYQLIGTPVPLMLVLQFHLTGTGEILEFLPASNNNIFFSLIFSVGRAVLLVAKGAFAR